MNDKPDFCKCGKELVPPEAACPACTAAQRSFWARMASAILAVVMFVIPLVLNIVTRGKFKPKA